MIKGFKEFLFKNNFLALAVAVIIGGAIGKVVSALAADIIMPLINPIIPSGDWRKAEWHGFKFGDFAGNVIDFLIIAFVVYLITKALLKETPPPPSKECPRCKETIALAATKCKFCTADI